MIVILALATAAPQLSSQARYQMPPSPPAPASEGEALDRDLAGMADRLRKQCLSEKGVRIAVDDVRRIRTSAAPDVARNRATRKEVADAAYAPNFDLARVIAALRAEAQYQAQSNLRRPEQSIALLQKLPKADQIRYARYISGVTPRYPLESCKG